MKKILMILCLLCFSNVATAQSPLDKIDDMSEAEWQSHMGTRLPGLVQECETGVFVSCITAALAYEHGYGTDVDIGKRAVMFVTACQITPGKACQEAADFLMDQKTEEAARNARPLYEAACWDDVGRSCANASKLTYQQGDRDDLKGDARLAVALIYAERACDLDDGEGCTLLGAYTENGLGVQANPAKAQTYYNKACQLGHQEGCQFIR